MARKPPPKEHQFKKGQSGNPKGKPVGAISMASHIKKILAEQYKLKDGKTVLMAEYLAKNWVGRSMRSDAMAKLIANYVDGMPKMNIGVQAEVKTTPLSDEQLKRIARRALGLSESKGKKSSRRLSDSDKR